MEKRLDDGAFLGNVGLSPVPDAQMHMQQVVLDIAGLMRAEVITGVQDAPRCCPIRHDAAWHPGTGDIAKIRCCQNPWRPRAHPLCKHLHEIVLAVAAPQDQRPTVKNATDCIHVRYQCQLAHLAYGPSTVRCRYLDHPLDVFMMAVVLCTRKRAQAEQLIKAFDTRLRWRSFSDGCATCAEASTLDVLEERAAALIGCVQRVQVLRALQTLFELPEKTIERCRSAATRREVPVE